MNRVFHNITGINMVGRGLKCLLKDVNLGKNANKLEKAFYFSTRPSHKKYPVS